ncbi:MAG: hypothetical protein GXO89_17825 [Chlorobi bacterium]|nr:hypothetical protein [Chlorobiota bacterium]
MGPELIVKRHNWKSRTYILIYAIALLLMVKLIIGVITMKDPTPDKGGINKTEIREAR